MGGHVRVRRVYDAAGEDDGYRVLVDRLWPRGVSKEAAHVDEWVREVAPSDELRHWFGHDPELWEEFKQRYYSELEGDPAPSLEHLRELVADRDVTLVYAAKDTEHNNAVALRELLERSAH